MRTAKFAVATLFILVLALLATVVLAGVTLVVGNQSSAIIEDVALVHPRGALPVGTLKPGQNWSQNVGKIGEGADFVLTFREGPAKAIVRFNVYFDGLGPRQTIVFDVLPDGNVRVSQRGHAHSQTKQVERLP
jgi:hypothetical protein